MLWCFPGGTSRSQLDAAAATAAELGLELAPVELQYTAAFDLGSVSFRVVDPSAAAEDAVHVKAEVRPESSPRPLFFPSVAFSRQSRYVQPAKRSLFWGSTADTLSGPH